MLVLAAMAVVPVSSLFFGGGGGSYGFRPRHIKFLWLSSCCGRDVAAKLVRLL